MNNIPTPHISAKQAILLKPVLMPGDPKRAKFIAETYLNDAVLVNDVRGVQGYTGYYKGKRVSVMASGMGMPSIGIYSYELFNYYDVKNIIRVGSAGAIHPELKIRDIVLGMGACTNSNYAAQYRLPGTFAPTASFNLLQKAVAEADKAGVRYMVGNLYSSDTFYDDALSLSDWQKWVCLLLKWRVQRCTATRRVQGKTLFAYARFPIVRLIRVRIARRKSGRTRLQK